MERLKPSLVHRSYDSTALFTHTTEQIRLLHCTTKQKEACRLALGDPRVSAWRKPLSGNVVGDDSIIWLTSKTRDYTISHVALELLESFSSYSQPPILLHSLDHIEKPSTNLPENKRTACTLLQEAIFQLVERVPSLLRENKTLQTLCRKKAPSRMHTPSKGENLSIEEKEMSVEELGQLFQELLDICETVFTNFPAPSCATNESSSTPLDPPQQHVSRKAPIYWIIDRIDTCVFKARPKHIEPALKSVYQSAPELCKFANVLEKLVSKPGLGNEGRERSGGLRVLMTSIYEPAQIDEEFRGDRGTDEEKGGKGRSGVWRELLV